MRIALVTYEFPPDTGKGGIGTYTQQIASILAKIGHDVEVFCGTNDRSSYEFWGSVRINKVAVPDSNFFSNYVLPVFSERHAYIPFDVLEVPEINGNAIMIKEMYPSVPLLVKLHTPAFLVVHLNSYYTHWTIRLRFFLGALRRGMIRFYGQYHSRESDIDYLQTKLADHIVSPSISLKQKMVKYWDLKSDSVDVVPNPYMPSDLLLYYRINKNRNDTVLFIGKLNEHKGIVNLVKAIPYVVKKFPNVKFRLIGRDGVYSKRNIPMSLFIQETLKGLEDNYEIVGPLEYDDILTELGNTEICVFPSIWENFPMVCLEAMSAGCAVVGSREGGMSEMLSDNSGILINPQSTNEIANAVIEVLYNSELRHQLGANARSRVLKMYNPEVIGRMLEESYHKTIRKCAINRAKS